MNDQRAISAGAVGPVLMTLVVLWVAAVVWASLGGWLRSMPMPFFALLVTLGIAVPAALYFLLEPVRRWVQSLGLYPLTVLHVWRIPAALMFVAYGHGGGLPPLFWILAGAGDFAAGVLAWTIRSRRSDATAYFRIHVFGLADFIVAVGTGLAFTLIGDPRMVTLTELPMALIPLFGVGLSGASHLIAFDLMRRARVQGP